MAAVNRRCLSQLWVLSNQQQGGADQRMPIRLVQKKNMAYVPQSEEVDWNFPVSVWDVVMMGRYGYECTKDSQSN